MIIREVASTRQGDNKPKNKTANQMGHRGNTDLVFSHYRKLVPKEDGKAFFEITPSSVKEKKEHEVPR